MKKTLEVNDENEVNSLDDLVGKKWAFQCARYIYFGKVKSVNPIYIEIDEAQVIFNTGNYSDTTPSNAQYLPKKKTFLLRQSIEMIYPTLWK